MLGEGCAEKCGQRGGRPSGRANENGELFSPRAFYTRRSRTTKPPVATVYK